MTDVYLALGANLGERRRQIAEAVRLISLLPRTHVERVSKMISTAAQGGPRGQPRYLNACLKIRTALGPLALLRGLQAIEAVLGRKRSVKNAARTIDIDILLFGSRMIRTSRLVVPHPRMFEREFVMRPLREVLNLTA
jgi:2-amino-4-hydroxy-6-hydroxymethyldihydropteridine diphosphokinase